MPTASHPPAPHRPHAVRAGPDRRPWLAGLAFCLLAGAAAAGELPAALAGKIDPDTWRRVAAGEVRELLVRFDDAPVREDLRAVLAQRRLAVPDDAALETRAEGIRVLKQTALDRLRPGEALIRDYRHIPMGQVRFNDAAGVLKLLGRNEVAAVYEDRPHHASLAQSLPLVGQPSVAQAMGRTGTGTTVAVLDTGADYTLPALGGCSAPGAPATSCKVAAALDKTKTRWRSDLQPCRPVTAYDDGQRDDTTNHGTRVSGVVLGVAPGARIAAVDVFNARESDIQQPGVACTSDIIDGINWAIANRSTYNIVAINMSLGGDKFTSPCSGDALSSPIGSARTAGILSIAASGNEGYKDGLASPACAPDAVSVGMTYDDRYTRISWAGCTDSYAAEPYSRDEVACISNSAAFLTLLAPGAFIDVAGAAGVAGTSFAAPHVAGAVAVLKAAFPAETPTQIQARLTSTGVPVTDDLNGISKPRLDLLAAQGAPVNDPFTAATMLSGLSGQASGWNLNATKETGEPSHAGNAGSRSVWWQWTAPADGSLSLDTHGSGIDTLLAVYTGAGVSALTPVASNDDGGAGNTSGLSTEVSAGTAYRIAVDGKNGASGGITLHWTLRQAQSISFDAIGPQPVQSTLALAATAGSGLPVSFTSATPGVCTAAGNQASLIAAGTCTLLADQAGDDAWLPAPQASRSFPVTKLAQTIDFPAIADRPLDASPFGVSAGASSGLPVALATDTPGVCGVHEGQVSLTATGNCVLRASQPGNGVFAAAEDVVAGFRVLPAGGGPDADGDVPLPPWALLLLGGGLGTMLWRRAARGAGH